MLEEMFKQRKKIFLIAAGVAVVAIAVVGFVILKPWQYTALKVAGLPAATTSQIKNFQPYFYQDAAPHSFSVDEKSVSYKEGVLFATLRDNTRHSVALTQQELPESLANQSRDNFDKVDGADGEAYITYEGTKMVGGLFSKPDSKGKRTLVLLVANEPIELTTMEDLLRSLRPLK
jgi:hypothetical protein